MAAAGMETVRPRTAAEALDLSRERHSRFVAGGTALQLEWAKGLRQPERLIDLGRIESLKHVTQEGQHLRIGALTTLRFLERDRKIAQHFPLLAAAIRSVAAPSIRSMATVGGNAAGKTGCLVPALLALNANVSFFAANGQQSLPLSHWLRLPDATLLEAIALPFGVGHSLWTYRKIGLRAAFTPSVIGVSGVIETVDGVVSAARLALGGGSIRPAHLPLSESFIVGTPLHEVDWKRLREVIASEVDAPSDHFRTSRYRKKAAANAFIYGFSGFPKVNPIKRLLLAPQTSVTVPGEIHLRRELLEDRWRIRPGSASKIEGRFAFFTDERESGMLVGRILRAGIPHARILSIDTSAAEALAGVAAVVTHRDVRGLNAFGIVIQDQPAFCSDKVRFAGDTVAAVAAVDEKTAAEALSLIKVEYAPLAPVTGPQAALRSDAALVHEAGNLLKALEFKRGDVREAFAQSAHIIEAVYTTPRQMHAFMETEGGYAFVDAGGTLCIHAGAQHGSRDRTQLARILAMPEEKIRVVSSPTGGAFGGKDELTVQPALALLALKTGRKVRIHLDRDESVLCGVKRHPMTIRMRTGCDAEGYLLAQEVELIADGGAYASLGPAVLETALEHAGGPYRMKNVRTSGKLVYTGNGVCGAFRGFGANQMTFAVECQIDRLAKACGLDPFEMRRRNLRLPGSPGFLGQAVGPSERLFEMLEAAKADRIWAKATGVSESGEEIVGVGMALNYQGNGLGSIPPDDAAATFRLAPDGAIEALYGLDEIGQGLMPAIRASVSQAIGCGIEDVRPIIGDTGTTPDSGSTTASRGTYVVWKAATSASPRLRARILEAASSILDDDASALAIHPGGVGLRGTNTPKVLLTFMQIAKAFEPNALPSVSTAFSYPKTHYTHGNARFIFAFGATLARIAVNRVTGQVRVLDLNQHTAAGPVLDAASYLGQLEGGSLQALGFTLSEHAAMADGRYLTANFDSYMLPSIADAPLECETYALESLDEGDNFGPRGVGEMGIGAVTPAIANAVADAIGYWPETAPFDPEAILDAMAGGT